MPYKFTNSTKAAKAEKKIKKTRSNILLACMNGTQPSETANGFWEGTEEPETALEKRKLEEGAKP